MIQHLDTSLERHFRAIVPLPQAVDVSFATPDRRWGAARTKPTVNLFLWDVRRDTRSAASGFSEERLEDGGVRRHLPDPEVSLRYLVTAWAGEPRDEHQLLGAVLRGALLSETITPDAVVEALPAVGPVYLEVGAATAKPSDLWASIDGQLKPNLELTVRMFLDVERELEVGPMIEGLGVSVARAAPPAAAPRSVRAPDDEDRRLPRRRRGTAIVTGATANDDDPAD